MVFASETEPSSQIRVDKWDSAVKTCLVQAQTRVCFSSNRLQPFSGLWNCLHGFRTTLFKWNKIGSNKKYFWSFCFSMSVSGSVCDCTGWPWKMKGISCRGLHYLKVFKSDIELVSSKGMFYRLSSCLTNASQFFSHRKEVFSDSLLNEWMWKCW